MLMKFKGKMKIIYFFNFTSFLKKEILIFALLI
jgi:hypothetical protein